MQILVATHQLSWIGGADLAVTVAEHLQRLGHDVTVFAAELGEMTEVARASGLVPFTADERALPEEPDVVYAQDAYVAFLLADRFPNTPQAIFTRTSTTCGCSRSCPG